MLEIGTLLVLLSCASTGNIKGIAISTTHLEFNYYIDGTDEPSYSLFCFWRKHNIWNHIHTNETEDNHIRL